MSVQVEPIMVRDSVPEQSAELVSGRWLALLSVVAMLIGAAVRLAHLAFIDSTIPVGNGGLFIAFADEIIANGYRIPTTIPFYTDNGIPFAYPPLTFYIEALLIDFGNLSPYVVANWLPPILALLSLPAFYWLTHALRFDKSARAFAMFAFALLPIAFTEQVESVGLPEAAGTLVLILLAIAFVYAYQRFSWGRVVGAALAWALCVLAAPGTAYASVLLFFLFVAAIMWRDLNEPGPTLLRLFVLGALAMALSSPYWVAAIVNHGPEIFVVPFSNQHDGGNFLSTITGTLRRLGAFRLSHAETSFLWDALIFLGVLWAIVRRRWGLLAGFVILLSVPREGRWMISIPAALFVGYGLAAMLALLPNVLSTAGVDQRRWYQRLLLASAAIVAVYAVANGAFAVKALVDRYDRAQLNATLAAVAWVNANGDADERVFLISESPIKDWFPRDMGRNVVNMPYGAEWQPNELTQTRDADALVAACETVDCVGAAIATVFGLDSALVVGERQQWPHAVVDTPTFELLWEQQDLFIGRITETQ